MKLLLVAAVLLHTACGGGGGGGLAPSGSLQGSYSLQGFWLPLSPANDTFPFTEEDYAPVSGTLTIGASSWSEVFTTGRETEVTTGTHTVNWTSDTTGVLVLHFLDGEEIDFRFIDTVKYGPVLELHYGPYALVDSPYKTVEE